MSTQGTARAGSSAESSETPADRYHVVADGRTRALVCGNASNVALRIVPGLTVTARRRRWYPRRSIFLDGVYGGAPFCDNQARHYSQFLALQLKARMEGLPTPVYGLQQRHHVS